MHLIVVQRRQPSQPLGVLAAGFDVHKIAQRVEQRGFFLLRQVVDAALRRIPRASAADKARAQAAIQARGKCGASRTGRDMVVLSNDGLIVDGARTFTP